MKLEWMYSSFQRRLVTLENVFDQEFFLIPYPNLQKNRLDNEVFERKKRKQNQYQFQSNTDILKLANISQKCIYKKMIGRNIHIKIYAQIDCSVFT